MTKPIQRPGQPRSALSDSMSMNVTSGQCDDQSMVSGPCDNRLDGVATAKAGRTLTRIRPCRLHAAKLPSSARALLLALPDNPAADRARFLEELAGEMHSLPKRRQFLVALSFWQGSRALQRALYLGGDREFLVPRRDWRCRLRMHHMVRIHGRAIPHSYYLECSRCGKFFDAPYHPPADIVA